jgi:hypothetical protein
MAAQRRAHTPPQALAGLLRKDRTRGLVELFLKGAKYELECTPMRPRRLGSRRLNQRPSHLGPIVGAGHIRVRVHHLPPEPIAHRPQARAVLVPQDDET